jgi:hypothetical protein
MDLLNTAGAKLRSSPHLSTRHHETLFGITTENSNKWASLLWVSGGNLNASKCLYYYMKPKYNFNKHTITYASETKAPGKIEIHDPSTQTVNPLTCYEPSTAKRTLGVMLAPDGNSKLQFSSSKDKVTTFLNHLRCSHLNNKTKWAAINTVLEPAILYPLMASQCTNKEMEHIDKIVPKAKCQALGLNEHFPRAILHSPMHLGRLGLHTGMSKTTTTRINYFLHHTRLKTEVEKKLETSISFLQMEIGIIDHFLQTSYAMYSHLATKTLMK